MKKIYAVFAVLLAADLTGCQSAPKQTDVPDTTVSVTEPASDTTMTEMTTTSETEISISEKPEEETAASENAETTENDFLNDLNEQMDKFNSVDVSVDKNAFTEVTTTAET